MESSGGKDKILAGKMEFFQLSGNSEVIREVLRSRKALGVLQNLRSLSGWVLGGAWVISLIIRDGIEGVIHIINRLGKEWHFGLRFDKIRHEGSHSTNVLNNNINAISQ